ncbi:transferase hexapeptide repeat family protein [Terrimonas sp. NA20]|uniref:Transferase hexapeptide repeat family protein n=1 Tax=Terrimonas ginsenosidimutans TaxID=2908004 RepID=A0ABS9KUY1_9BACT|nr:transferase hexapeptide repeat family protein [Terrimonas ginsenosidimutans]MCG2616110.1 transferase hexapeptide repeat family protein [Terrimonas ginsenosidimutans]
MFYTFNGHTPVCHPSSYVHPQAAVTGNVIIGKDCYIGPGAALRGDWGQIILEDGCNVQENCTVHMFPGLTVTLKKGAHIGHGAVIHGATIGRHCLIGINAVIMDHVVLGDECIVGALAFIKEGGQFARRSLIAGLPAKFIKKVSNEMMAWKKDGTALYQALPAQLHSFSHPCEPLRKKPATTITAKASYETWRNRQKQNKGKP